jgi:CHAD domain-containing protein
MVKAALKSTSLVLGRSVTVEDGFRIIFTDCLQQIQRNAISVVESSDIESLHQMRVGLRRLRTAMRLFAPWMHCPESLRVELGWLDGELGAARDADVLADGTLVKIIEACPLQADLAALKDVALTIAMHKRQQAADAVSSERYMHLMHTLGEWCEHAGWQASLDRKGIKALARPLRRHAPRILMRRHEALIKRGKKLAHATPQQLHQVRIAAKKARYATLFFQSFLDAKPANRYLKRLGALQDVMGWLNDATSADRLLGEIETSHPDMARSASFARGYLCAVREQDRAGLERLWKRFSAVELPGMA